MKSFLTYLLVLLGIILVFQCIGEWVYTYVYENGSYRNKAMWVRDLQPSNNLDFVILGNSRANYHIDPLQIEGTTGLKGLNLGYNSSHPFDSELMLQEVLKNTNTKRVFVQLDHSYRTEAPDEVGSLPWLPFIKERNIQKTFSSYDTIFGGLAALPFYRYQKYESELGFRNIALSALGKSPKFVATAGFTPNFNSFIKKGFEPFVIENEQNAAIESLIQLCKEKDIQIEFFTAPVYQFKGDYDVLELRVSNYSNLSKTIKDKKYFIDEIHLNAEGAQIFTEIFIKHYFE